MIAFSWAGGKTSQLKWLLPIIDNTEHVSYIEPFGGSAAVLLNKKPSLVETYNDIHGEVVNFFRVLRNDSDNLLKLLELTPYAHEEFADCCSNHGDTDLERARTFFVRARQVRMGLATTASPGRWAYIKKESRRGMSQMVSRWLGAIEGLDEIVERLKQVQIENFDALEVIRRYDYDNALHYLDPPYLMDTRSGGKMYAHEFSEEQHSDLLDLIVTLKGKVILSGYQNQLYDDKLRGWCKRIVTCSAASARPHKNDATRREVIWANYDINFGEQ